MKAEKNMQQVNQVELKEFQKKEITHRIKDMLNREGKEKNQKLKIKLRVDCINKIILQPHRQQK